MADHYHPSAYDSNRRDSSPGRRQRGDQERFPPGRPPLAPSFSKMDPRRTSHTNLWAADSRKRVASKSPDGAQTRKQQKPDRPQENGVANGLNDSRRSSLPNGVSHGGQPNHTTQSLAFQRPSMPAVKKPGDAANLSSPRSPHDSTTSGRSTPQQRPSTLSKDTADRLANVVTTPNTDLSNVDRLSLSDLLVKFSSDIACRAALEHERNQAHILVSSAQREYNEMRKHFKYYPAIEERKSIDKKAAQGALKAKEKLLNEHTVAQQAVVGALASLIGQLATPKPDPNAVSRAEFDSVKQDLKQEIANKQQLRDDLADARRIAEQANSQSVQVPKFASDVELLKRENTVFTNWKIKADTRIKDLSKVDQRLEIVEERSTSTENAFNIFKTRELNTLATKQQFSELETKHAASHHEIGELQQAQALAKAAATQAQAQLQPTGPWSDERLQKLLQGHAKHAEDVIDVRKAASVQVADLAKKFDAAIQTQKEMSSIVEHLESEVLESKEAVHTIRDRIEEEGKDSIVKRVKRLDVLVNNLSSKIGDSGHAPMAKRIAQLEHHCKALQEAVRSTEDAQQPLSSLITNSGSSSELVPLVKRLETVEKDVLSLIGQQESLDPLLKESLSTIESDVTIAVMDKMAEQLSEARDQDRQVIVTALNKTITESHQNIRKTVDDLEDAMRTKVSENFIESLQGEVSKVVEQVKKLQAQHQRTKSTSHTPTPSLHGAQPNGTFQASPQNQQVPNGVAGSPQINGSFQPHSSYDAPHTQQPQNTSQLQQVQDLQMQISGLVAVTQQLKMRCDNLQTDDVVRAMLEQFSQLYPDTKNINATVQNLHNSLNSVQQQLTILQQKKTSPPEQSSEDVKNAIAKADGATKTAHDVSQKMQEGRTEINTIKERLRVIEAATPSKHANDHSGLKDQLALLRTDLENVITIANDADRLSKQHSSRLSKVQPEELKKRVDTLEGTVAEHSQKVADEGASAVTIHAAVDWMKKRLGELQGKADLMEEQSDG